MTVRRCNDNVLLRWNSVTVEWALECDSPGCGAAVVCVPPLRSRGEAVRAAIKHGWVIWGRIVTCPRHQM